MSKRWNGRRKGYRGAQCKQGGRAGGGGAKAKQGGKAFISKKRVRVYPNRDFEARALRKNTIEGLLNRQTPLTRRPPMPPLGSSVLPEYAGLGTNMLKLGQQHLPFGMKPRTIDAPDHY